MSGTGDTWDGGVPAAADPGRERLRGETFLCFGWSGWEPGAQTWNQVLRRLAYRNRVLFVPPPLERTEVLGSRFAPNGSGGGLRHREDHLYVYRYPRFLPNFYKSRLLIRAIESARLSCLRRALSRIGGKRPILYLLHPKFRGYVGGLNEKMVMYHVLDEYSGYLGANKARLRAEERSLLDTADLTLCVSETLRDAKAGPGRRVVYVPNGVDFDQFVPDAGEEEETPEDLAAIPSPRAGYVGRVCDKLDYRLLLDIARAAPEISFCFAGPVLVVTRENRALFEEWAALRNVHLLGAKPLFEIPRYVRAFDACLMPYAMTREGRQRYPLKLHEYLAAGKPVVSVPLPCLEELHGLVRTAESAEGWVEALRGSFAENGDGERERRIETARRYGWDRVVIRIEDLVRETLASRGADAGTIA
ncbi:MAG: glycosyltransferase [Candidatus Eisenbacteria bacterium]|nr:glycosyltransferase [Candidatus Eisenbacteria bacterium]